MRNQPLADRLRPKELAKIVGQDHLLSQKGTIGSSILKKRALSFILWGPPGCGKTTLAIAYAKALEAELIQVSGVSSGIADLKLIVDRLQNQPLFQKKVYLFVDEIHRYNKAQQDYLLPFIEKGLFYLIGATTENPSFSLNNALLSRVRVLTLEPLSRQDLETLFLRYEEECGSLDLKEEAKKWLIDLSQGDGRYLFNLIETLEGEEDLTIEKIQTLLQRRQALFDKSSEQHYNLISALHKSVRGSDPDASLYWFCRMLEGGVDPLFIARRLIRMASEDIGLADPVALQVAMGALEAYKTLGSPEGELMVAQAVVYLSLAPKSNAIYKAYKAAKAFAHETNHLSPPKIIINPATQWMAQEGFGEGYIYDHDTKDRFSGQNYFPQGLPRPTFYQPLELGFERDLVKRINYFSKLRKSRD